MFHDFTITAQAADRIGNITNYFSSTRLQIEYLPYLVGSVLIIVALIWGSVLFLRWNARRNGYIPTGTLKNRDKIFTVLNHCIDKRVRMDFQLDLNRSKPLFASCMPVDITDQAFVLECSATSVPLAPLEPDREIAFFFTVRMKPNLRHYRFASKITKTTTPKNDFFDLHIELPDQILPGQKRNFLRITPPDKLIMGLSIWPVQNSDALSFESSADLWGKPSLSYMSEDATQFDLDDISANGISLSIPREYAHLQSLPFGKARSFAMLLDFWDPTHQTPLKIWVICRVQKSIPDLETSVLMVGAQFVAWGQAAPDNPDLIKWKRLYQNEEITLLGDWIIKRHLEEFRGRAGGLNLPGGV